MTGNKKLITRDAYFKSLAPDHLVVVKELDALIRKEAPKLEPFVLGGFLGYGRYTYRSVSNRTGEWMVVALARQKNYYSLYICAADNDGYLAERNADKLGNVSVGKSCIRFKKLEDLHIPTLKKVLKAAQTWAVKTNFNVDARTMR